MNDSLCAALTLVQGAFADVAQGMAAPVGGGVCSTGAAEAAGSAAASIAALADVVAAAQSVVNAASAVQTVALALLAARETVWVDADAGGEAVEVEVDRGVGFVDEFASTLVGPLLGLSPGSADARLDTAAVVAAKLPTTLTAMASGGLDPWRARCVAEELREATAQTCALVEARVFPAGLGDTPRALTARVRRALAVVDADAVRVKAAKARLDRFIRMGPSGTPGMTDWWGCLPAADSAACQAAIEALAHQLRGDIVDATLDQCRADALVDLITGNATITTTVTLLVPVETLTVQEPAEAAENAAIIDYLQANPSAALVDQDRDVHLDLEDANAAHLDRGDDRDVHGDGEGDRERGGVPVTDAGVPVTDDAGVPVTDDAGPSVRSTAGGMPRTWTGRPPAPQRLPLPLT